MKNFVSRRRWVVWTLAVVVMLASFVYSRAGSGGNDGDVGALRKMALEACCDRNPGKDFDALDAVGNDEPTGLWSNGTTMWVADDADRWVDGLENNDRIYAYGLATMARDSSKDFNRLNAAENDDPEGIWSDGTTMWVADQSDEKLYAYDMTTRERVEARDFDTLDAAGNDEPKGIWSDGTTMWVADDAQGLWFTEDNDKIYAYVLATRVRDPSKDFNRLNAAGNDDPEGIWSDGTTMWVADQSDEKLYAYDMTTRRRVPAKDFNTLDAAGNDEPTGIWSDGRTMWVADDEDEKIYAYNMPQPDAAPPEASTDFNGDGRTDFVDFFLFADAYGSTDPRFDLDGNGVVDFADFFKFVDAFGS